jgi:hypothetical protein
MAITPLNNNNQLIFVTEMCFLCSMDWNLKYYLDEPRP